jgi:hypothetical protein
MEEIQTQNPPYQRNLPVRFSSCDYGILAASHEFVKRGDLTCTCGAAWQNPFLCSLHSNYVQRAMMMSEDAKCPRPLPTWSSTCILSHKLSYADAGGTSGADGPVGYFPVVLFVAAIGEGHLLEPSASAAGALLSELDKPIAGAHFSKFPCARTQIVARGQEAPCDARCQLPPCCSRSNMYDALCSRQAHGQVEGPDGKSPERTGTYRLCFSKIRHLGMYVGVFC